MREDATNSVHAGRSSTTPELRHETYQKGKAGEACDAPPPFLEGTADTEYVSIQEQKCQLDGIDDHKEEEPYGKKRPRRQYDASKPDCLRPLYQPTLLPGNRSMLPRWLSSQSAQQSQSREPSHPI